MKTLTKKIIVAGLFLFTHSALAQDLQEMEYFSEAAPGYFTQQIKNLADSSSCSKYSWKSRGRAPAGYIRGVALTYARSVCRVKETGPVSGLVKILAAKSSGNAKKDVFAHYQSIFTKNGLKTNVAGEEAVHTLFTLGMGLGMRESSGKYCEGWDVSAGSNRPSSAAEAGPFQVSYDSMGVSSELRKLYQEYQASPNRCFLDAFKTGATCKPQKILGTGAGADFQVFVKSCPAFATEYAMTLLRILRAHFGPINRQEAEVVPACSSLLNSVQKLINSDPEEACSEIY
jgi:hypothetical protein